ncbi:MAG: replication initiator protein A [Lachnospiraceae bacterium]|nr:replication initiator protein A [Lachnospiraceae bacterium]MBP3901055.1 replication initiator protein A [Blautia sp.]
MSFDYFYGPDDAEQYSFYRIPKRLITGDEFQDTSTEAKLLYGLMLDRLQLSIRNQWLDSLNRVYIIYTVEDIMADLHCGNQKACKLLSELENKTGLIKRKRQGLGKPSLIYVLKFSTSCPQNDSESHFKTCENHTSGDVKTTSLDMWKSHGNNTDFNKPEYNKTNPIYPGQASAKITVSVDGMGRDEMDERRSYERYFREHLYIDDLKQSYPYDHGRIDEILELLVDTVCSTAKTIRCAGEDRPAEVVKSRFMKLDYGHIQYVLDCIHDNTTDIRNIKAYMLTTLYNAPITIDHYYQAKVNHDMYGWREEDA